jgi:probable HAF family extracellular repeat protein
VRTFQGQGSVAHAALWTQDTQGQWGVTDLGSPQGVRTGESKASGINNAGQIVGYSNINANGAPTPSSQHHAFMWVNNTMIDLNGRVPAGTPLLINAIDINDSGQIIALAAGNMDTRIFLLTR